MIDERGVAPPTGATPAGASKRRSCLGCGIAFESAWAGERVCTRCKRSSAWRKGEPIRSYPSKGR